MSYFINKLLKFKNFNIIFGFTLLKMKNHRFITSFIYCFLLLLGLFNIYKIFCGNIPITTVIKSLINIILGV